jgi:hypothetical protein
MVEFEKFASIGRLKRDCVVTEKIDGTNAQVYITEPSPVGSAEEDPNRIASVTVFYNPASQDMTECHIYAGSRNRWVTPENDNFGWARWVKEHAVELVEGLGPGRHYGEWWGSGVQRRYGLTGDDKRFSLFNVNRWQEGRATPPACCGVVPILYQGPFTDQAIDEAMTKLRNEGSVAAPGFMFPEGIVVYHVATKTLFKRTIENDEAGKTYGMIA